MLSSSDLKSMIGPGVTLIFIAAGGWFTLYAVAQETEEFSEKVEVVERRLTEQDVLQVKVEQLGDRLQKMESLLEKTIEIQQQAMQNQSAICQATNANCR